MRVHHPAFGVPSPTADEIRAACGPEARALWDAASSLASWRVAAEDALTAAPFVGSPRDTEPGVGPGDLARAIVALHPDVLGVTLAGSPLDRASTTWFARIGPPGPLPLAYAWGRRWAAHPAAGAIDVPALVRSLPDPVLWALSRLDPRAVEGLITAREAYCALVDQLAHQGLVSGTVGPAWLEREPDAAWVDRLGDGPGMVLLGEPCSGRRAVLAQLRRLLPRDRGVNVDNWHGGTSPDPRYRARPRDVPASVAPGLVCAWSHPPPDAQLLRYAVELALDPEARFQLVLVVTAAEWSDALRVAPDLSRFPAVPMGLRDDELLEIWLAQRPHVEDLLGVRVDLRRLMPLPPDRLRALLAAVDPYERAIPEQGHGGRLRDALGGLLRSDTRASTRQLRAAPELMALDAGFSGLSSRRAR